MPASEMSDLHPSVAKVECRRDRDLHIWLSQLLGVHTQPLRLFGRFSGQKSHVQRLVSDPSDVCEGSESKRVVVVPVSDYDSRQWPIRHTGE